MYIKLRVKVWNFGFGFDGAALFCYVEDWLVVAFVMCNLRINGKLQFVVSVGGLMKAYSTVAIVNLS